MRDRIPDSGFRIRRIVRGKPLSECGDLAPLWTRARNGAYRRKAASSRRTPKTPGGSLSPQNAFLSNPESRIRNPIYLLLLLPILFLFTGCGRETLVERATAENTLLVGNGPAPESLDPQRSSGISSLNIQMAIYEGLVRADPETLEPIPGLAERWEVSADGTVYRFHLRPGLKWSDGEDLVAQDFIDGWQRLLNPAFPCPNVAMFNIIEGAEKYNRGVLPDFVDVGFAAPDPRTLEIKLNAPVPYFLSLLLHPIWSPVQSPDLSDPSTRVGTGPFRLIQEDANVEVLVQRNPHYWDAENVLLDRIRFFTYSDPGAEERAFLAGQLHLTDSLPPQRVAAYRKMQDPRLRIDPYLGTYYILFNHEQKVLADPKVREAFTLATDRRTLVNSLLGAGQEPAFSFVPSGLEGYTSPVFDRYDPVRARELLAEAGFPGGEGFPELSYLFNSSESHRLIAEALQSMWREQLGVEIELVNQEWRTYLANRSAGNFELARAVWIGDYPDPYTFLQLWELGSPNNWINWQDAAYDAAMTRANSLPAGASRREAMQEAEAILLEDRAILPLYFYVTVYLKRPEVTGWHPTLLDWHPWWAVGLR